MISKASKVMLNVIQHKLDICMEQDIAIEQAGFTKGRDRAYTRSNHKFTMGNGKVDRISETSLYVLYRL